MKRLVPALRNKLKELEITELMMDLTATAVMPHCEFRVNLAGCTNACFSPYFSDFGVLGSYDVELVPEKCSGCRRCVDHCTVAAITMEGNLPVFNKDRCFHCGGCEEFCPESAVRVKEMGYKVVVGGSGARRPVNAQTVTEYTDLNGVLAILEKTCNLVREKARDPERVFTVSRVIAECGVDRLKPGHGIQTGPQA